MRVLVEVEVFAELRIRCLVGSTFLPDHVDIGRRLKVDIFITVDGQAEEELEGRNGIAVAKAILRFRRGRSRTRGPSSKVPPHETARRFSSGRRTLRLLRLSQNGLCVITLLLV